MDFEKENIEENLLGRCEGGFSVPENYFPQLTESILAKISNSGFSVPKSYFETLDKRIIDKKHNRRTLYIYSQSFRRVAVGIAASLIFISGIFFIAKNFYWQPNQAQNIEQKINSLSDEEIINYIGLTDLNINDTYILEAKVNILETKVKSEDKNQMEEFLINNTDEQQIIEEL